MSNITIQSLELENVKRIKALVLEPTAAGLTVIGGNNNQGKTSVLDAICWALGGEKYRPSNAARDGSTVPPRIKLTLSNGLIVERSGKNSALKVSDPFGKKGGLPQTYIKLTSEDEIKNMQKMLDMFDDNDDVQNVWHNWEDAE